MPNFNPCDIKKEDGPFIVFSDQTSGWMEFLIKFRTKGNWNHVMLCLEPGYFVSQGNTYSKAPFSRYMRKNFRLKFVSIAGITEEGKQAIRDSVEEKLQLPWWKKMYDFPGILGQAIGVKGFNVPWWEYCSEDAPNHLKKALKKAPLEFPDPINGVIKHIPVHASPQEFNDYLHSFHSTFFPVFGKWEGDD